MAFTDGNRTVESKWFINNENKISYDKLLQRNYVWSEDQKEELIDTIIRKYPLPPMYARQDDNDRLWILDGQQRIKTIQSFLKDEFSIYDSNTEPVEIDEQNYEIAGLKYSELPAPVRSRFNGKKYVLYTFQNMTDEEVRKMFMKLNNGSHLTKIELLRSMLSEETMELIDNISSESFFNNSTAITDKQKNRFVDQESIMQIITLFMNNGNGDLGFPNYSKNMIKFDSEGVSKEQKEEMINIAKYLSEALPEKEKFIKKVNIPIIFMVAKQAIKDDIKPEKFGGLMQQFFSGENQKSVEDRYNDACAGGSAKETQVKTRLNKMLDYYLKEKENVKNYKKPEPKTSAGKGAPRTVTPPIETDPNNTVHTGYESYNAPVTAGAEGEIVGDAVH